MKNSKLVYSTESGKVCPDKKKKQSLLPQDGIVRLIRQTKGRKGKGVTLINGIPLPDKELKKLAKSLKQKCGCGGTVKNSIIEIQGDHRDLLEKELAALGYKVKHAGG
ncbi:MAG: stress response translation initiation inhibitor YciH [Desulfocapsa sp.]|nr:MAG: stress response translation initiation inhibitor YciH [Desulfocapsa sp.]